MEINIKDQQCPNFINQKVILILIYLNFLTFMKMIFLNSNLYCLKFFIIYCLFQLTIMFMINN